MLPSAVQYPPGRIISIGALRGLDMLVLIGCVQIVRALLKYLGSPWTAMVTSQFLHIEWHGFHFIGKNYARPV